MFLNHLAGFSAKNVDDLLFEAKGKNPLWGRKILSSLASSSSRKSCHSFRASASIFDNAADLETNSGSTNLNRPFRMVLAADLACLSVKVM